MLKYKVKLNEPKGYNEIVCDELYSLKRNEMHQIPASAITV